MRPSARSLIATTALLTLGACNDPTTPPEPGFRPQLDLVEVGDNCIYGGDDFQGDAEYPVNECDLGDDGFDDETADFRLVDDPVVSYSMDGLKDVYFVHELRFTASGAGYRIPKAVFLPLSGVANTGTFGVRLLKELQGAGTIGHVGGCFSAISNALDCAEFAMANSYFHDEPRICIWNETVGASGSVASFCEFKVATAEGGQNGPVISNRLPIAQFSSSMQSKSTTSATWKFNAGSSSDPESSTLSYQWEVSDGTTTSTTTNAILNHTFTTSGVHSVRLRVTEPDGGLDVNQQNIAVTFLPSNQPPVANFAFTCSGLSCSFTDQSTDADGSIASRQWAFGDGQSSTAQNPVHTFSSGGTYSVTLTVTDNQSATDSEIKPVSVSSGSPLSITLYGSTLVSKNKSCTWSSDVYGGTGGYSYQWVRGGSVVSTASSYTGNTGTTEFDLTLTVTSGGQSAHETITVTPINPPDIPC